MRVCDRCKKEMDTKRISTLAGAEFELCTACANHIANHIKNYKVKKGGLASGIGKLLGG